LTREDNDDAATPYPNNEHDSLSLWYAARLHIALTRATGGDDRGLRRARFLGVLRPQRRPAVLIEGGFLSHPGEAARIDSPVYRQLLAEALAGAFKRSGSPHEQSGAQ
jgi:N-acetylmuramoyl-L-alanine amidase